MVIGVLKEPADEHRVSLLPEAVATLIKKGLSVWLEAGAGLLAFATDAAYQAAGAEIKTQAEIGAAADVILSINAPAATFSKPHVRIGVYQPLYHPALMERWAQQHITTFSLDMLPRTTRAQSMDVLSSQANIAGYKAVLLAANTYGRYLPMFMTAAGSVAPAKVLILGAGVAGLQAIATARRLGAVVEVFDTRPAVKEEVQSLGGRFIEVDGAADTSKSGGYAVEQTEDYKQKQQQRIGESVAKADIVITTAQIPGRKAPQLITEAMLANMRTGSVVIDLAAATGGNTPVTVSGEAVAYNGVTVIGNSNLAATLPSDASKLYGKNVLNFLALIINKDGQLALNWNDDLVKGCCITAAGNVVHERVLPLLQKAPA